MAYTTIDNSVLHFQTKAYTGDGNDDRNIVFDVTDTTMQPDFLWSARRDSGDNLSIYDSVRGDGKELRTAETGSQYDRTNNIQALQSNGFQVGSDGQVNASSGTYVSWAFKAGNSSGSSNGDGSISSTVTANTTAGFSIVKYTGTGSNATVGHGLGAVPQVTIVKGITNSYNWGIYHHVLGNQKNLNLNSNSAANNDSSGVYYNSTTPTSTVFSIGTNVGYNASSADYIAYCFVEKQGYSKFGSYTGNGNADGTYVHLGFRPAWIMIKRSDSSGNWFIHDNKRVTFNVDNKYLAANDAAAEQTFTALDMLSNGFKLRTSGTGYNASSGTFTYYAFAESPFVNSSGVPNNAR